ncbi:MAG: GNAT family N-acetyltransferase [Proteobacteria bacterium]|nr:MAG: GNAT family N-acetyltransferase [Pseudomonadota bacterium]
MIRIDEYQPGDEFEILDLFRDVFRVDRSIEQWRRIYLENPAGPPRIVIARTPGNEIVGHMATIPAAILSGNAIVRFGLVSDLMVQSRFRGVSSGPPLADALARRLADLHLRTDDDTSWYAVPNRVALRSSRNLLGSLGVYRSTRFAHLVAEVHAYRARTERPGNEFSERTRLSQVNCFDSSADETWARRRRDHPVMSVRDAEFLNWRFCNQPDRQYLLLEVSIDGKIRGHVIMAPYPLIPGNSAAIVECTVPLAHRRAYAGIVDHCLHEAQNRGFDNLAFLAPPACAEFDIFRAFGFKRVESRRVLCMVDVESSAVGGSYPSTGWHYSLADFDLC